MKTFDSLLRLILVISLLLILLISCNEITKKSNSKPPLTDTVKVQSGLIAGKTNLSGDVHIFLGIPFAAPPVGDLRWKEPQPVNSWNGVRSCTEFSAGGMQPVPKPFGVYTEEFLAPQGPLSEDCLYLNIWTAAKNIEERRPVIVYIHGGAFFTGSGACPIYDGESMARKGVVFITINYRLGIFGFFAHPELTAESANHSSGNYGLLDQIAALKWIKNNIVAFGGDPDNVTIEGQSAGSMSVNCLVATPLAKGLFQRAIGESGACMVPGSMLDLDSLKIEEEKGIKFTGSLKLKTISDLRKVPDTTLVKNSWMFMRPVIDGYLFPASIPEIFNEGKQNDVPVITGWNENDGGIMGDPIKAAAFISDIKKRYGKDAQDFLKLYPAGDNQEALASQAAYGRDMTFGIQGYAWANTQIRTGQSNIYLYFFTRKLPATPDFEKYGAFHTGEVPYALNNLAKCNRPWEPADHTLADMMSDYWVNFAKTGDPNGGKLPVWPSWNKQDKKVMIFGEESRPGSLPDEDGLEFILNHMK